MNGMQLSWADLEALGADLKSHFSALFDQKLDPKLDAKLGPIAQELKALKSTVGHIATTASKANDMAAALEGRVSKTETSEKNLKDRLAWLETRVRALNLKVQGRPESTDLSANLDATFAT